MRTPFTITGPEVEARAETAELGLSRAINFASAASRRRVEATYYVRDKAGDVTGRAESYSDGSCSIYGSPFYKSPAGSGRSRVRRKS